MAEAVAAPAHDIPYPGAWWFAPSDGEYLLVSITPDRKVYLLGDAKGHPLSAFKGGEWQKIHDPDPKGWKPSNV